MGSYGEVISDERGTPVLASYGWMVSPHAARVEGCFATVKLMVATIGLTFTTEPTRPVTNSKIEPDRVVIGFTAT